MMIELSEQTAPAYLRDAGRVTRDGELLIQSLSGGIANVVLKVFDTTANGNMGNCFVVKQPLPRFRSEAEWRVDIGRVVVERDCMALLGELLPAGSVPEVLWFDEANHVLAMSCAPTGATLWKKALLAGQVSMDAATHAGMLLAMLHSSTMNDAAVKERYGDPKFFVQQRIDPYLHATAEKHAEVAAVMRGVADKLLSHPVCLIHGDFSPKNIFLIPAEEPVRQLLKPKREEATPAEVAQLLLLDFEVAFYGHPMFDVATLINHFALKGFYHHKKWRPFMLAADNFWQTYRHTAEPALVRAVSAYGGQMLGALLLARVDGKSPVEYLTDAALKGQVRAAGLALLSQRDTSLDHALDTLADHFDNPA